MAAEKNDYYSTKLSAERLRKAYEIAPPLVKQYLNAEIDFVLYRITPGDRVVELGCGYGRVLSQLAAKTDRIFGIDTSFDSLQMAKQTMEGPALQLVAMDAAQIAFETDSFDLTACIQNGVSAFKVDQKSLMAEAVRITRPGGTVFFSSYADIFWPERLAWFRTQAEHGLIGEIDENATGNGVIVCKDGFKAATIGPEDFKALAAELGFAPRITIVDNSSVFCEIIVT